MVRAGVRIAMIAALLCIGWLTGKAQTSQPDFEIVVNASSTETSIECVRGCELSWVERGLNPNSGTMRTFRYACHGGIGPYCPTGKVGGWIKP